MKEAEGGGFGAADYRSYSFWVSMAAWAAFIGFARHDLGEDGQRHLATAFGVQSNGWLIACLIAGWFASAIPNQQVAVLYTRYTGRLAYGDDRIGYAKSGGRDIAAWSGFLSFVMVLFAFARWVPQEALAWARPLVLVVATAFIGLLIARFLAARLFFALYGPPRHSLR